MVLLPEFYHRSSSQLLCKNNSDVSPTIRGILGLLPEFPVDMNSVIPEIVPKGQDRPRSLTTDSIQK